MESASRLRREVDQRVHLVRGWPWRDALAAYLASWSDVSDGSMGQFWTAPDALDKGDLLVTVLDTRPRVVLCLERSGIVRKRPDKRGLVVSDAEYFLDAIPVPALTARLGRSLPVAPATLSDDLADKLLTAIAAEVAEPTPWAAVEGSKSSSTNRARSSGLQAAALLAAEGECTACQRDYAVVLGGRGALALEVHHLDPLSKSPNTAVWTDVERVVVVCGGCHNILHGKPAPTLEELVAAWSATGTGP